MPSLDIVQTIKKNKTKNKNKNRFERNGYSNANETTGSYHKFINRFLLVSKNINDTYSIVIVFFHVALVKLFSRLLRPSVVDCQSLPTPRQTQIVFHTEAVTFTCKNYIFISYREKKKEAYTLKSEL